MYLCIFHKRNEMVKRRCIFLIFGLLALCRAEAQPRLVFEPDVWDFGTVQEADGRVSHTFTGVNKGDRPLVILDIMTTCGCTVPEFSRKPVLPGERTQVTVTYDPFNRPGAFSRELGVYSSERVKVATLTIRGRVVPRPKSIEELYPIAAGGGVRLAQTLCAFSYVRAGQRMQSAIGLVNTSSRPVEIVLQATESSGLLAVEYPRRLAPGERGAINFSYLNPVESPRYGTLRDVLEIKVDGVSNDVRLMVHGIGADPPVAKESPAPVSELSENILKFGGLKQAGLPQRKSFELRNAGNGPLVVRALEHDKRIATSLLPGREVPPGGSIPVEVTFDPRQADFGIVGTHLVLITNDPSRPMRRLRITALVEE